MSEENSSGSFGARLLIILYGIALVIIGAYPIQREYGSVLEFVRQQSSSVFTKVHMPDWSWTRPEYASDVAHVPVREKAKTKKEETKDLDKLTHDDRMELDSLINGLNP